jgi:hypothetical protein
MKTIVRILERAGGYRGDLYLRIETRPIRRLSSKPRQNSGLWAMPPSLSRTTANGSTNRTITRQSLL